jgi:hypothetical protein
MTMRPAAVALSSVIVALVACLVSSCSFTSNLDKLDNGQCAGGTKACTNPASSAEECVSLGDPAFGCSSAGCSPCFVSKGTANCSASTLDCAIAACNPQYADCDNTYSNGCEVSLQTDPTNCGRCGNVCPTTATNGTQTCSAGRCKVGTCNAGWADCNGLVSDGCETPCPVTARLTCVPSDAGTGYSCE